MRNALRRRLWWVGAGLAICGAIVFAARKEHKAAQQYERDREIRCADWPASPAEQDKCKHDRDGPTDYLPWWYMLVVWPDGIATWAIIATGFVIAWQSYETRRAAAISQRALILEYRPRVIVRTLKLIPITAEPEEIEDWRIEMVIANVGGTMAYVQPWSLRMEWYDMEDDRQIREIMQSSGEGFDLAGGQSRGIEAAIEGEGFKISMYTLGFSVQAAGKRQHRYPVASGTLIYRDDNGITRRTGFRRAWDAKDQRFCPSTDPEYEYQD
jgi:hypothetical protein